MKKKAKSKSKQKKNSGVYLAIAIIAVIVVIALVFLAYPKQEQNQDNQTINKTEQLNLTIVVMQRDIIDKGSIVLAGPILSERYNLSIRSGSTVRELKTSIYQITGLAHFEQKLIWKGYEMDESRRTLGSYNVTDGSRIHVFVGYIN